MKRKTPEEFERYFKKNRPDLILLSEYKGIPEPIFVKNPVCKHDWWASVSNLIHNHSGCPVCAKESRIQKNKNNGRNLVLEKIKKLLPDCLEIIGEYEGYDRPLMIRCKNCGKIFNFTPHSIISGQVAWCKCAIPTAKLHRKKVKAYVGDEFIVNGIKVKGPYKGANERYSCTCMEKQHDFITVLSYLEAGHGCPFCANEHRNDRRSDKSRDDFFAALERNGERLAEGFDYEGSATKVGVVCKRHGTYYTTPSSYKAGHGCPRCACRIGEEIATNGFKERFPDALFQYPIVVDGRTYRFDAFSPKANMALEYNGRQHYEEIETWKGSLRATVERDAIKRKWCEDNGVALVVVDGRPFEDSPRIQENELRETVRRAMDAAVPPVQTLLAI